MKLERNLREFIELLNAREVRYLVVIGSRTQSHRYNDIDIWGGV